MRWTTVLLLAGPFLAARAAAPATLQLTQTIALPGVQGRFDHFAMDVPGRRLFVAALGNNTLEVIDLAARQHIQSVAGMAKPTGVLYDPEPNRIYVANGEDGTLKILDGKTLKVAHSLTGLEDADNLRLDPKTHWIYLGYGEGALGIVDQRNADTYQLRERVRTRPGARTCFFSKDLKELYLAVPQRGNQPAAVEVFQTQP